MHSTQSAAATTPASFMEALQQLQKAITIKEHIRKSACNFGWVSDKLGMRFGEELDFDTNLGNFRFREYTQQDSEGTFIGLIEELGGSREILRLPVTLEDVLDIIERHISGPKKLLLDDGTPNVFLVEGWLIQKNRQDEFYRTDSKWIHPVFVSVYGDGDRGEKLWSIFSHSPYDNEAWLDKKKIWLPKA